MREAFNFLSFISTLIRGFIFLVIFFNNSFFLCIDDCVKKNARHQFTSFCLAAMNFLQNVVDNFAIISLPQKSSRSTEKTHTLYSK